MNSPKPDSRVVRFGGFEADLRTGELRRQGIKIKVQTQPFQILEMLLERPGDLITREEIRQKLWPADTFVDFDHGLNAAVNKLREALNDSAESPRFIETLARRGYRFIASVEGPAAMAVVETPPADAAGPPAPQNVLVDVREVRAASGARRRWVITISFLAAVLLTAAGIQVIQLSKRGEEVISFGSPAGTRWTPRSIAVLPLENLSEDPNQEYFADGMTDALITDLARIGSLRVISRTSVMQYKKARAPLPEIARKLKVDGIIEGTVQRSGNHVRISVQLIHGPTDTHLWAKEYERDVSDILDLQSEMAQAIVDEIRVQLTPEQKRALTTRKPVNPEAYEAYLKGRYFLAHGTPEGVRRSQAYFQRAIQKDPNNALAYVGMADYYNALGFYGLLPPREIYARWKMLARKAVELDETLPEAHTSLAQVMSDYEWDWAGAEREFQRALELNPNSPLTRRWHAQLLSFQGRHPEAIAEVERAQDLDPLSLVVNSDVALCYYYARDYDRAIEAAKKTLELDATYPLAHVWLGLSYLAQGKKAEASEEFQRAGARQGNLLALALLGHAYGRAGRISEARAVLRELETISKQRFVSAAYFTLVYLGMGDRDRTFEWMDKTFEERSALLVRLRTDPILDSIRSDPPFQEVLRRMNFPH